MPVRIKNMDLEQVSLRGNAQTFLGDMTADSSYLIFRAPEACTVNRIDFYQTAAPPATTTASVTFVTLTVAPFDSSDDTLGVRGGSQAGIGSESWSANVAFGFNPSANNSLTVGAVLELQFSQANTAIASAVLCYVEYTLNKRKAK